MRYATSLQWIFDVIKRDYDIKTDGINFLSLSKITYDAETMTPVGYYQRHRAHVMQNPARAGERIHWDNRDQANNEIIGPVFQDYILYNVLKEIDPRLLEFVQTHYQLKMQAGQRLMDVKDDIFSNIPHFLEEIKQQESPNCRALSPVSYCSTHWRLT